MTRKSFSHSDLEMSALKRVFILLQPSFVSGLLTLFSTLYIAGLGVWSALSDQTFVNDLINVFSRQISDINTSKSSAEAVSNVLSTNIADNLGYVLLWGLIGCTIYILLMLMINGLQPVKDILDARLLEPRHRNAVLMESAIQLLLRVLFAIATVIYFFILKDLLLPFSLSLIQYAVEDESLSVAMVGNILLAITVTAASIHFFTVLLRLSFLKLRLFGSADYSR